MTDSANRPRGLSFGSAAELYERARPSYPPELIDRIVALLPGPRVVEAGAGTGKATALLARPGLDLTCVEPDAEMARILQTQPWADGLEVVVSTVEDWQPDGQYDGLVSAQAWHWTDPATRWEHAARILRPGGVMALFWNHDVWGEQPVHRAIDEVYARHGVEYPPVAPARHPDGSWPADEITALDTFEFLGVEPYGSEQRYPPEEFVDFLNSTSCHLLFDDATRNQVTEEILAALRAQTPTGLIHYRIANLYLARRTSASSDRAG